ncbi:4Fe-4S binding protein, partial [Dorea sp. NSJ-36]
MEKLYINKEDCCGCSACLNICPKHAIYMKHDEKGYLYPEIRKDPYRYEHPYQLFALSKHMVTSMIQLAKENQIKIEESMEL